MIDGFVQVHQFNRDKNLLVEYIKRRLKRNQNCLIVVCGQTGSGKSYATIRLAEEVDESFHLGRVVFKIRDFMRMLDGRLKKGNVLIYDEAGTGINARDWWSISNKLVNYVLQTFRQDNIVVFFTVPDISFLDSHTRKLFHVYVETMPIDYKNKIAYLKPLLIDHNALINKTYYKYLIIRDTFECCKLKWLGVGLPQRIDTGAYEDKKKLWRAELHEGIMQQLGGETYQGEVVTPLEKEVFLLRTEDGMTMEEISDQLGLSVSRVSKLVKNLKKAGYNTKRAKKEKAKRIMKEPTEADSASMGGGELNRGYIVSN